MSKKIVKNEKQFAEWFRKNYKKIGFSKMIRGDISRCPDFIMLRGGKEIGVELETFSSNFLVHKHQLDRVDEILCLVKDVELGKPVREVKELKFEGKRKVTLSIDEDIYSEFQKYCEENGLLMSRNIELFMEKRLSEAEKEKRGEYE